MFLKHYFTYKPYFAGTQKNHLTLFCKSIEWLHSILWGPWKNYLTETIILTLSQIQHIYSRQLWKHKIKNKGILLKWIVLKHCGKWRIAHCKECIPLTQCFQKLSAAETSKCEQGLNTHNKGVYWVIINIFLGQNHRNPSYMYKVTA